MTLFICQLYKSSTIFICIIIKEGKPQMSRRSQRIQNLRKAKTTKFQDESSSDDSSYEASDPSESEQKRRRQALMKGKKYKKPSKDTKKQSRKSDRSSSKESLKKNDKKGKAKARNRNQSRERSSSSQKQRSKSKQKQKAEQKSKPKSKSKSKSKQKPKSQSRSTSKSKSKKKQPPAQKPRTRQDRKNKKKQSKPFFDDEDKSYKYSQKQAKKLQQKQQSQKAKVSNKKSQSPEKKEEKEEAKSSKNLKSPTQSLPSPSISSQKRSQKQKAKDESKTKQPVILSPQEPKPQKVPKIKAKPDTIVPVDDAFSKRDSYHIYVQRDKVWNVALNQTQVLTNNNKFYIIQLLQSNSTPHTYIVFRKWGRVGYPGQQSQNHFRQPQGAKSLYNSKLREKTSGGYTKIQLAYGDDSEEDKDEKPKKEKAKISQSSLVPQVQRLIQLIFDKKKIQEQLQTIGFDVKKLPLGKLSKETIKKGFEALKKLAEEIEKKSSNYHEIANLNNIFYSNIPHNFGFRKMKEFMITTIADVKLKIQMLESLENIKVANDILEDNDEDVNIIDQNYAKLDRSIEVVNKNSRQYQIIDEYMKNTHARTHSNYSLTLQQVFRLHNPREDSNFESSLHNKMLLWHGSRLTNYAGILSQGLRIAPPEAPVTGYMFGKGVYFADMVSKSANYCFANSNNTTALLLLCQVALGDFNEKTEADYYANLLPPGKSSTKGVGSTAADESSWIEMDGMKVPIGEGKFNPSLRSSLLYNQFIVYRTSQIRLKYLLKVEFQFGFHMPRR